MPSRLPFLLVLVPFTAACGDIDVVSVRSEVGIPIALQGEWRGAWTSQRAPGGGLVTLGLQGFAGEPVVAVSIDNPCLVPSTYEFSIAGRLLELRAAGQVVLAAELGDDRTMTGTYQCAADWGTWQATWQHDLPVIRDLSGVWEGAVRAPAIGESPLLLYLEQGVRGGVVVVDATVVLPNLLPTGLRAAGTVHFRVGTFELQLGTVTGAPVAVELAAVGDTARLAIDSGLWAAALSPWLPFETAVWQASWQGR